jgi:hypothetical protein
MEGTECGTQSSDNDTFVQHLMLITSDRLQVHRKDSADTMSSLRSSLLSLCAIVAMKKRAMITEPCEGSASHLGWACCAAAGADAYKLEARAADMGAHRLAIPGIDDTTEFAISDSEENGIALGNASDAGGEQSIYTTGCTQVIPLMHHLNPGTGNIMQACQLRQQQKAAILEDILMLQVPLICTQQIRAPFSDALPFKASTSAHCRCGVHPQLHLLMLSAYVRSVPSNERPI